ncbi:unnamed protein product [Musa hybrid cultivar]
MDVEGVKVANFPLASGDSRVSVIGKSKAKMLLWRLVGLHCSVWCDITSEPHLLLVKGLPKYLILSPNHHKQLNHAGIYVGGSKVVHFTRKKDSSFGSSSAASAICPTFPDCGFRQPDSGVILCCLDCFLGNGALYRFEYGVPPRSSSPTTR